MAWHPSLAALRDLLAQLSPRREESELIVDDAGIPRERVRFSDQADVNWHEILKTAERLSRLPALLEMVLSRYPGVPALTAAVVACRGVLPPGVSSEAQPSSRPDGYPPVPVDLAIVTAMTEELEPVLALTGGRASWSEFTLEG